LPPIFSLPSTTNMNLNPAFNVNNNMKNSINNLIPHLPRMTKTIPNTPYMSNGGPTPFETFLAEASYLNNYNNMNNFYNMNRIASATVYKKKRKRKWTNISIDIILWIMYYFLENNIRFMTFIY